jgi:hypothetical protein
MIIEFKDYDEQRIIEMVVKGIRQDILSQKKYWGKVPEEGHYTDFDKFKNQIAQLVADRIYQDMINSGEVTKRIDTVCEKAEKIIDNRFNKKFNKSLSK